MRYLVFDSLYASANIGLERVLGCLESVFQDLYLALEFIIQVTRSQVLQSFFLALQC